MARPVVESTGARVARERKARGLTQRALSRLARVSYATLAQIEQDRLPASSTALAALARALSVPVTTLTGQPYLEELRADHLDILIQPIREALDAYDTGPDLDAAPRPLRELAEDAERLCVLVRAAELRQVATDLPGLLAELAGTAHSTPSESAWQTLGATYRTAYDVASKLGFTDLATVALDRLDGAAQRASDASLAGVRQYFRALAYARAGDYARGRRIVALGFEAAAGASDGRVGDVVSGQLNLAAAVLAAREGDAGATEHHLAEAERLAGRTGPAERVHWLSFGPTNVRVHRVSVLVDLARYPDAVRAGRDVVFPEGWPATRRARHHTDVAYALLRAGHPDAAFASLVEARKAAPQQTRYYPRVRETYGGIESAGRRAPDSFHGFGDWLGR
ncbi:helix-turn-helix domain-containing protein [Streptomyces sp. NPDC057702]|uniref:helix-turn-helix domain-containing protein n=1 Tax=unclassified Streptomyces TaxID=2593676 RepID=UPI00369693DB